MPQFHFVADELCLDFINTEAVQQDDRVDLLGSFDDLMTWYAEAGVVDTVQAKSLTRRASLEGGASVQRDAS